MLPGLYIFFAVPLDLINTNFEDLDSKITLLLIFFLLLLSWSLIGYWLVFKKGYYSTGFQYLFVILFVLFFTFDVITPTTLSELTGDDEQSNVREPLKYLLIESNVAIFSALLYIMFVNFKKLKKLIFFISLTSSLIIVLFTFQSLLQIVNKNSNLNSSNLKIIAKNSSQNLPNIYHIVLDAYSSNVFLSTIQSDGLQDSFDNFIFYKNNRSNYEHTNMSTASFMQGERFKYNGTVKSFINEGKNNSYLSDLKSLGYRISFYDHGKNWVHPASDYIISAQELDPPSRFFKTQELIILDFWILRIAPTFIQKNLYSNSQGFASKIFTVNSVNELSSEDRRTYDGKILFERMISDEISRESQGELVFMHSYLTHGPYIFTENCNLKHNQDEKYYLDQIRCTNSIISDFINNLKKLNRFSNSLIIIHSDHGTWEIGNSEYTLNDDSLNLLNATNLRGQPGEYVDNQTRALLLVKFPLSDDKDDQELEESESLSQLIDIVPTIMFQLRRQITEFEGIPLQNEIRETRIQKVSMGFKQLISPNKTVTMGEENPELEFIEYEIRSGVNYELKGKQLAKWS